MSMRTALLCVCLTACANEAPKTEREEEPARSVDAGRRDAMPASPRDAASVERDARAPEGVSANEDAGAADDAATLEDAASEDSSTPSDPGASDDIYGTQVPRADTWWVDNGRIYHGDDAIRLFGINWFGLETDSHALFGPSQANRTVADFLTQIESLGFNALRVPLSPESIRPGTASASWANHGSVDTGREHFEELAAAARDAGIYMLWDVHTCASAVGFMKESPLDPACTGYGKRGWLDDLKTLATLAKQYEPYVLGIDLFNEPHGLSWTDWKALVEEAGELVLRENPHLLLFVEGVGAEGYQGDAVFWGENLTEAKDQPPRLPASRLVYSPHVYGPSVFAQPYFADAAFPNNMPEIWSRHFGYLFAGKAPVVLGEFGGKYVDADKTWQDALAKYLLGQGANSFFYWCLNPNSGDTGGLLQDDWRTVNQGKLALLKSLMK